VELSTSLAFPLVPSSDSRTVTLLKPMPLELFESIADSSSACVGEIALSIVIGALRRYGSFIEVVPESSFRLIADVTLSRVTRKIDLTRAVAESVPLARLRAVLSSEKAEGSVNLRFRVIEFVGWGGDAFVCEFAPRVAVAVCVGREVCVSVVASPGIIRDVGALENFMHHELVNLASQLLLNSRNSHA